MSPAPQPGAPSPAAPGASDAARTAGTRERPQAAAVDLEELTRRVYALWLEDLRVELARRGGQP